MILCKLLHCRHPLLIAVQKDAGVMTVTFDLYVHAITNKTGGRQNKAAVGRTCGRAGDEYANKTVCYGGPLQQCPHDDCS